MRITVLGKSPSWQDDGGACSGYLVQEDGYTLLLDCGSGVFAKLRSAVDYREVDAVLITHLHSDHFFDLVPYTYALINARRREPGDTSGSDHEVGASGRDGRTPLYLPPGATGILRRMLDAWSIEDLVERAFDAREYAPGTPLALGPLEARFCEVPHFTRAFAIELARGGSRFTFGADCGPNQALIDFARDTGLLLIEATLEAPESGDERGHLTAREAGEHGRDAGVRRLVVTHFSDELDPERTRSEASAGYGGPVELAREGAMYEI